jgi:hypothetical protein
MEEKLAVFSGTINALLDGAAVDSVSYCFVAFAISLEGYALSVGRSPPFTPGSELHLVATGDFTSTTTAGFDEVKLTDNIRVASTWVVPLLAARMIRGDNFARAHVASFLQTVKGPAQVVPRIHAMLKAFPMAVDADAVLGDNVATPWFKYRLVASSLPALYDQALASAPLTCNRVFGPHSAQLIADMKADPTNVTLARAFPATATAALAAVLEGLSMSPENWFVGERSKDSISSLTYRMIREAARRESVLVLESVINAQDNVALAAAIATLPSF